MSFCGQAQRECAQDPALWLRGMPSGPGISVPVASSEEETRRSAGGWRPGHFYTDASGGLDSSDVFMRRVACVGCAIAPWREWEALSKPVLKAWLVCPLPGPGQTVNRGELWAVIMVLEAIELEAGCVSTIFSDSKYVVGIYTAFEQTRSPPKPDFNDDLRMLLFKQMVRHNWAVRI